MVRRRSDSTSQSQQDGFSFLQKRWKKPKLTVLLRWIVSILCVAFFGVVALIQPESPTDSESANDSESVIEPMPTKEFTKLSPLGRLSSTSIHSRGVQVERPDRYLKVCSFNIQFLGNSKKRENAALAAMLASFDIVVVQELIAPPCAGRYPDGTAYKPDPEVAAFIEQMELRGFSYLLSEEDTGMGPKIHLNSSATEWWITFYRADIVEPAMDLPGGFLASGRAANPILARVPYAFPFRTRDGNFDFVLISVHLTADAGPANRAKRQSELTAIAEVVRMSSEYEKDFLVLGDMNIENAQELRQAVPASFEALGGTIPTNVTGTAPYDQVLFRPEYTAQVDRETGCVVFDLIAAMQPTWNHPELVYPGDPYAHDLFRQYYSDHNPIGFIFRLPDSDSDPNPPAIAP